MAVASCEAAVRAFGQGHPSDLGGQRVVAYPVAYAVGVVVEPWPDCEGAP